MTVLSAILALPGVAVMVALWVCPCAWAWRWLFATAGDSGNSSGKAPLRSRANVRELAVPGRLVGFVIGRRGQRARQLEDESGARLRFRDEEGSEDKASLAPQWRTLDTRHKQPVELTDWLAVHGIVRC